MAHDRNHPSHKTLPVHPRFSPVREIRTQPRKVAQVILKTREDFGENGENADGTCQSTGKSVIMFPGIAL